MATHVFGKPMIAAGKATVTVPVCGTNVVFATPNEPFTKSPGPAQASGSKRLIVGAGVNGLTVTVKLQLAIRPAASVAVHVTVVVPTAKIDPDGGKQFTVAPGQLSFAIGVV